MHAAVLHFQGGAQPKVCTRDIPMLLSFGNMPGGSSSGLKVEAKGSGLYVVYASEEGEPAITGRTEHNGLSVFTHHLIKELNDSDSIDAGLNDIFEEVRRQVREDTSSYGRAQTPVGINQLTGGLKTKHIRLRPRPESTVSCPTSKVLPGISDSLQLAISGEELARRVYMAILATEAVYYPPAERTKFLYSQSRTFSQYLIPRPQPQSEHVLVLDVAMSNTVIVAYQGTADLTDLWTDLKYPATPVLGGKVHKGFYDRATYYNDNTLSLSLIAKWLGEGKDVVMTGHSLGGATAIVNTLRILDEQVLDADLHGHLACVTFASPLVGDKQLQKNVNKQGYTKHFFTYVYETDIVPRVLLLKEDLQKTLQTRLKGMKFFEWAQEKIIGEIKSRFKGWLSGFVSEAAAGHATDMASEGAGMLSAWVWEEYNPPYFPFRAYYFCKGVEIKHLGDDDMVTAYMKQSSKPEMKIFMNHQMSRYAAALEALRAD